MKLTKIEQDILAYCAEDDMGFWIISRWITKKEYYAWIDLPDNTREEVLQTILELMESDLIEAGRPNGPTFTRFPGTALQVINYVRDEWIRLGRQPSGGDVSWFRATPKGLQVAKELDLHT